MFSLSHKNHNDYLLFVGVRKQYAVSIFDGFGQCHKFRDFSDRNRFSMYCLQWLIPVLLIPKPINPAFLYNHAMFLVLYLVSFFLERKPCAICSLVFAIAVFLICYSCQGNSIIWPCE